MPAQQTAAAGQGGQGAQSKEGLQTRTEFDFEIKGTYPMPSLVPSRVSSVIPTTGLSSLTSPRRKGAATTAPSSSAARPPPNPVSVRGNAVTVSAVWVAPHGAERFVGTSAGDVYGWSDLGRRGQFEKIGEHPAKITAMTVVPTYAPARRQSDAGAVRAADGTALSVSGRLLVTGGADCALRVWFTGRLPSERSQELTSTLRPYGSGVAVRQNDRCLQTIAAHDGPITCVATGTSAATKVPVVISASTDKTVRVWAFDAARTGVFAHPWLELRQVFAFDCWITAMWTAPLGGQSFPGDPTRPHGANAMDTAGADSAVANDLLVGDAAGGLTVFGAGPTAAAPFAVARHISTIERANARVEEASAITRIAVIPATSTLLVLSHNAHAVAFNLFTLALTGTIQHPEASMLREAVRFVDCVPLPSEELLLLDSKGTMFVYATQASQFIARSESLPGSHALLPHTDPSLFWLAERQCLTVRTVTRRTLSDCVAHSDRVAFIVPYGKVQVGMSDSAGAGGATGGDVSAATARTQQAVADGASYPPHDASGAAALAEALAAELGADHAAQLANIDTTDLLSVGADSTVCFWSPSMTLLRRATVPYASEVTAVLPLLAERWLATGHEDGALTFWGLDGRRCFSFKAHDNSICALLEGTHRTDRGRVVPWRHLATISYDGCLALWELPEEGSMARCDTRIRVSTSELLAIAYDAINCVYIVGDGSGEVSVWAVEDLLPQRLLRHKHPQRSPDGHMDRLGSGSGSASNSGALIAKSSSASAPGRAHVGAASAMVVDGNYVFTGGDDGRIFLWETRTGALLQELDGANIVEYDPLLARDVVLPFTEIVQLCRTPDGDILACCRAKILVRFDVSRAYAAAAYHHLSDEPSCMALRRGGAVLAIGLDGGSIDFVRIAAMTPVTRTFDPTTATSVPVVGV